MTKLPGGGGGYLAILALILSQVRAETTCTAALASLDHLEADVPLLTLSTLT